MFRTFCTSFNVCPDIIQNEDRLIKYASRAAYLLKLVAMAGLDPDPWVSQLSVSMTCVLVCIPFVLIIAIKAGYFGTGAERKAKSCCAWLVPATSNCVGEDTSSCQTRGLIHCVVFWTVMWRDHGTVPFFPRDEPSGLTLLQLHDGLLLNYLNQITGGQQTHADEVRHHQQSPEREDKLWCARLQICWWRLWWTLGAI